MCSTFLDQAYTSSYNWTPDATLPDAKNYILQLDSEGNVDAPSVAFGPIQITDLQAEANTAEKHDDSIRIGLGVGVPLGFLLLMMIFILLIFRFWKSHQRSVEASRAQGQQVGGWTAYPQQPQGAWIHPPHQPGGGWMQQPHMSIGSPVTGRDVAASADQHVEQGLREELSAQRPVGEMPGVRQQTPAPLP